MTDKLGLTQSFEQKFTNKDSQIDLSIVKRIHNHTQRFTGDLQGDLQRSTKRFMQRFMQDSRTDHWRIPGWGRGTKDACPLGVQILSFSHSFWQNIWKIIG